MELDGAKPATSRPAVASVKLVPLPLGLCAHIFEWVGRYDGHSDLAYLVTIPYVLMLMCVESTFAQVPLRPAAQVAAILKAAAGSGTVAAPTASALQQLKGAAKKKKKSSSARELIVFKKK